MSESKVLSSHRWNGWHIGPSPTQNHPSVTLGRGVEGEVGWGNRLLGVSGNCPAVNTSAPSPEGCSDIEVEESEDS